MKRYWINEFDDKEKYLKFMEYMLKKSEMFTFVYFKYRESERTKRSTKNIQKLLKPHKICSRVTNHMPGMETRNDNNHIYKLVFYRAEPDAINAFSKADRLFAWDYPEFPMDISFFKDGFAWFVSVSHEKDAVLYTDDKQTVDELIEIGVNIEEYGEISVDQLFYWDTGKTGDGFLD